MQTFENHLDARLAIMTYIATGDASKEIKTKLMGFAAAASSVDTYSQTVEYLYAHQAEIGNDGRDLVGGLAGFMAASNFHGMGGTDNRGGRIAAAMMRANGEKPNGINLGKAADDPEPSAEYAPRLEQKP